MTLLDPRLSRSLKITASLDPLIRYWREQASGEGVFALAAQELCKQLDQHPELSGPLRAEAVAANRPIMEALVTCVLPAALQRFSFAALVQPGSHNVIWATPRFERELLDPDGGMRGRIHLDVMTLEQLQELNQFIMVSRTFYGRNFFFEKSVRIEQPHPETGHLRYFQMRKHLEHVEVRAPQVLPTISVEAWNEIAENLDQLTVWRKHIPLEQFELYGISIIEATEITEEMTLSAIQTELIAKSPLADPARFERIRTRLAALLRVDDLRMDVEGTRNGWVLEISPGSLGPKPQRDSVIAADINERFSAECQSELLSRGAMVIEDLEAQPLCSPLQRQLKAQGQRCLMVLGLTSDGTRVGWVNLSSSKPHAMNNLSAYRLADIVAPFTLAVQRSIDNFEERVEAIITERFTALHPSVEWKFRRQAIEVLRSRCAVEVLGQDILFHDVYPFFGASDVRNSTFIRNETIQQDLTHQLKLARDVLMAAVEERELAYLRSRLYRLDRWLGHLAQGLESGDEARILEFLRTEIEPLFNTIIGQYEESSVAYNSYVAALDSELGVVHNHRRHYEFSMALIKERTAEILSRRQREAQAVFPHYFELHKSDGVDHSMYVGASIHPQGAFAPLYLHNLRLWQLQTMVEIAAEGQRWTKEMTCVLESAHLLLIQDRTLTIRFSQDEKQFNVDGAYNARYEILKKRLDKAEVRGTGERITQPGKVTIVYSHPREATEYREYIEYLAAQGLLEPGVEELDVAPLQGVTGLRALRVTSRVG